jgi:sigma-B regulation protein RsbQ
MFTIDPLKKNNVHIKGNIYSNECIIFSHGFGTDQHSWDKVIEPFVQRYKIILYDLTGAGHSDSELFSPDKYDTLESYAHDLLDICERLFIKKTHVVAHSVSGMIALLAAIKQPDLFDKMVFIGSSPRYLNDEDYAGGFTQDVLNNLYHQMQTNYYAWVSGFAPMMMQNADKPELAEMFANTLGSIRPDIAISVARTIFQSDYRSSLDLFTKDVLLVHAENDSAVPLSVANYMKQKMVKSSLSILPVNGHFPHYSHPKEISKAIEGFISN